MPPPERVTVRNDHFEVIGDERLSPHFTAAVGELLVQRLSRIVPPPDVVKPVLVDLTPIASFEGKGPYLTYIYPSGQVKVSVVWGKKTTRTDVERALAQGYLTYLAGAYSTEGATVPLWLELAVQQMARVKTVASHRRLLGEEVKKRPAMSLGEILLVERGDEAQAAELAPFAYWLLRFLEGEARTEGQLRNFLLRLFRGEAPLTALNATFGGQLRSTAEAEMWWLVGLNDLVRSSGSPMWPIEQTRHRLSELSRSTFQAEGKKLRLFPEDLWEHRASETLRRELRYRTRAASLDLASFHVFYHNALLSLTRVFESVLVADEGSYREALVAWRHDLRTGDELAEDADTILDDLEVELNSPQT